MNTYRSKKSNAEEVVFFDTIMMVIISPAFSQTGVIKALLGGAGIGLTCVSRAAALGELLPSSSWSPVGTPAMILASFGLAKIYGGGALPESGSSSPSFFELDGTASVAQLVVAGVLVGAGSSVGGGCTSGNGIQGLAALSPAVRLQVTPIYIPWLYSTPK